MSKEDLMHLRIDQSEENHCHLTKEREVKVQEHKKTGKSTKYTSVFTKFPRHVSLLFSQNLVNNHNILRDFKK